MSTKTNLKFKERKYPYGFVAKPGSATQKRTGEWAIKQPDYDPSKCAYVKLGADPTTTKYLPNCYLACPDSAIIVEKGGIKIDYEHCKGCLLCVTVCVPHALTAGPSKLKKEV